MKTIKLYYKSLLYSYDPNTNLIWIVNIILQLIIIFLRFKFNIIWLRYEKFIYFNYAYDDK